MYFTDCKHRTLRNQQDSPFLRLPSELRNQVYAYIFEPLAIEVFEFTVLVDYMSATILPFDTIVTQQHGTPTMRISAIPI
jgi:hypothetical protein